MSKTNNMQSLWTTAQLRAGDQHAFEALYRQYYKGLCAFAAQYIPLSEAEEVVQDTMMWLWEHRESLDEQLSLKTLLFTIVKNKALNLVTHEEIRRRVHQEIVDKFREAFEESDLYLNHELFSLYRQALAKLPPEVRQAFEMNRHRHLTHKEIAQQLGVSPQTVNYRIGQALKLLRAELKDYLPLILLLLSLREN
ncbi:MAG: RNA polymerase sigma-70 factor [Bacteroides sp.]